MEGLPLKTDTVITARDDLNRDTLSLQASREAVRQVLKDAGETEYTPMLYGIFERGVWTRYRDAIESTWPAYMKGERTPSEAATELLQAIEKMPTKSE